MKIRKLFILLFTVGFLASCQSISFDPPASNSTSGTTNSTTESISEEDSTQESSPSESNDSTTSSSSSEVSESTSSSTSEVSESTSEGPSSESSPSESTSEGPSSESSSESTSTGGNKLEKTKIERTFDDYIDNNVFTIDNVPHYGTPKLLVIPTLFTDSSNYIPSSYQDNVRNDIELAFNGTEAETGWQSVKTYYSTLSGGQFVPTAVVTDWYNSGYSSSRAGSEYYGEDTTNTIVENATNWYFNNNPSEKRTDYDYNGDGYIDGVMIIYAAPNYYNENVSYDYTNFWAYCYWLQDYPNVNNPVPNAYFWCSYDFMYGTTNARSRSGATYNGGDTRYCTIDTHTFIHETGHIIGYDYDLYDVEGDYTPAGAFSMEDYNVGSHDPFSVMGSGWADPYIPTETTTITIGAFQKTKEIILLTNEWNSSNSPFDEYLLLELYTPTGLNEFDVEHTYNGSSYYQGPTETGIRLWHVDARLATYENYYDYDLSTNLFTDPLSATNGATLAMSNTYSGDYASSLGSSYYDYNLLQLIRNNTTDTYRPTSSIRNSDLFGDGDSFNMSTYRSQFKNVSSSVARLNSGETLGWSFSVSISGSGHDATATITCTKN